MENLLCIKGKIIGKGKPLVCVPVMESSKEFSYFLVEYKKK